jgi:predicted  nucleic acid-binding Zn-ribbon protein
MGMKDIIYNFEHCNGCGLIWDDTLGNGASSCPRCVLKDELYEANETIESMEQKLDTQEDELRQANNKLEDIKRLLW